MDVVPLRRWLRNRRLGVPNVPFGSAPLGRVLPDAGQLPGAEWSLVLERAWPPGSQAPVAASALRARDAGLICVMRIFDNPTKTRRLFIQVFPFVSASDADDFVDTVDRHRLDPTRAQGTVLSRTELDEPHVAGARRVRAITVRLEARGRVLALQELVCTTGTAVCYVAELDADDPAPIDQLVSIAEHQIHRLGDTGAGSAPNAD